MRGGVGLDGPNSVAVSPDGKNVYATSRASSSRHRLPPQPLDRRPAGNCRAAASRRCRFRRARRPGAQGPDVVIVSPDGAERLRRRFLRQRRRRLRSRRVERRADASPPTRPAASPMPRQRLRDRPGARRPEGMAISGDGEDVYVAAAVVERDRRTSGAILPPARSPRPRTGRGCIVDAALAGCTTGVQLSGANAVAVSPDDDDVYVTSLLSNSVTSFDPVELLDARPEAGHERVPRLPGRGRLLAR